MNFDYSEEQRLLADSVQRFVANDYGFEARKRFIASPEGHSPEAWRTFAEMGLLALPLPAQAGGFGGGAVDLMAVMDAFGHALVVEPYLATVGLGAQLIARGASAAMKDELLPRIAEGDLRMAFAHGEEGARYDPAHVATRARREGDGFVVDGAKRVVLHASQAHRLVVSARTGGNGVADPQGISLFCIDPGTAGIVMREARTLDGMRAADIDLKGVRVPAAALVGAEHGALPLVEEVLDFATALVCAEAIGALRYANEATLEYLKTRKQFGVPIGSFQALQHRMVDMVISAEQARSMASLACARVDTERDAAERRRAVSMAKIKIADACRHVSEEAEQLHGGMGMSDELKVSHTFRRLTVIAQQFGDADYHLARYAR
jgi:alkylation response protein AidB-like acyl-CoA dehydrogenase